MSGEQYLDKFLGQQPTTGSFDKLEKRLGQIWEIAREFGLDPFPTHFEIIPPEIMYDIGSMGLPARFSHWTHGKAYRQLKTGYDYGLEVIYELVINSDPAQAFLLENNDDVANTVVMAHVLGHTDFFKHHYWFANTRRDMPHAAAVSAERIAAYEFQYGRDAVEGILDSALSIAEHIDPFQPVRLSRDDQMAQWKKDYRDMQKPKQGLGEFDDLFEDPSPVKPLDGEKQPMTVPLRPEKDLLGFIADFAPYLDDWQRDILHIVRGESHYFYPQRRTKIMNEGWASYWHRRIMHEMSDRGYLSQEEQMRWVVMHSNVLQPSRKGINPYYLGMKMFDFIEAYHNGNLDEEEKKWLEKENLPTFPKYGGGYIGSPGQKMVMEVRKTDDDQSFIRNHFNKIPADRMEMYIYEERIVGGQKKTVIASRGWEKIRDGLVASMNNCGYPYLVITDANYRGDQSLYIKHLFEGQELDINYLKKTLPHLHRLWGRPVFIETVVDSKNKTYSFDGKQIHES